MCERLERGTDEKGEISLAVLGLATICGPRVMIAQTPAPAILAGAMGGDYWDKAALIIFEAATSEDAETMAKNGPAVKAHAFQAQVRPFDVFWVTNKFAPGTEVCAEEKMPQPK